jgi:pilus assembly protein TadC
LIQFGFGVSALKFAKAYASFVRFAFRRAVRRRRERIRLSLPDGLDLLAICMEAGLGLDQGIVRVGQELRVIRP